MLKRCTIGLISLLLFNGALPAKDYLGAELFSTDAVKYGKFEMRMRAVSGSGIISSFFLYYDDSYLGSPEPWEEIDVEVLGKNRDEFQSNIITGTSESKKTSEELHAFSGLSQNYHTYTMEWTPDYIAWYFNGKQVRRSTGAQVAACTLKAMTCRSNLWISDAPSWAGQFSASQLPVYQFINWIRYSKYTPGAGINGTDFTPEWTDEFDSFKSVRWGKGNWTFDGNLVDFSTENIVIKDGYCILCLTTSKAPGFSGTVPQDAETSMLNRYGSAPPRIHHGTGMQSFSVTLDGKLVTLQPGAIHESTAGLLIINKEKNVWIDHRCWR